MKAQQGDQVYEAGGGFEVVRGGEPRKYEPATTWCTHGCGDTCCDHVFCQDPTATTFAECVVETWQCGRCGSVAQPRASRRGLGVMRVSCLDCGGAAHFLMPVGGPRP